MISGQVDQSQEAGCNDVRSQKPPVAHARIEHGHHFGIAREPGRKKDDRDEREDGPEQAVDIRNEVEVIIHQHLPFRHRALEELLDVLTEIDRNGDQGKHQRGEKERAQVFPDNISIEYGQAFT